MSFRTGDPNEDRKGTNDWKGRESHDVKTENLQKRTERMPCGMGERLVRGAKDGGSSWLESKSEKDMRVIYASFGLGPVFSRSRAKVGLWNLLSLSFFPSISHPKQAQASLCSHILSLIYDHLSYSGFIFES